MFHSFLEVLLFLEFFSSRLFNFSFCFSTFLLLCQVNIKPAVPNQRAAITYVFYFYFSFFFIFGGGVTSSKKSLGAGITDPAEKLKKNIHDHWSCIFVFSICLMNYCLFIVSNFLMTWCCLFIFYGCWLVTFSLHDLFPIFVFMIPLIIYCLFFSWIYFFNFPWLLALR